MIRPLVRLSARRARRHAKLDAQVARAQPPETGVGAEAPIRTASEDRFRRADFAARISGVLSELSLREGRVFAIRGGWGFGKSSLKNLIAERLDARRDGADWLDFNPWQWGDGDAIARALFGQIADRLGGEHSKAALARADALRRYGAMLTGAAAPLKAAGGSRHLLSLVLTNASLVAVASAIGFDLPALARLAAVLAALAVGLPLLGRVLLYFGRERGSEPLEKVRATLEGRLRELDRPLVIFVDDIDRLEPEQIRVLLRQVKANANLPNIVFVLLFQPSIVERALDPVADGHGRAFLEKVVQASFDLPSVPASIVHRIFGEELSELAARHGTAANGFSERRWGNAFFGYMHPLLRNMRDARRLLSSIAVHMPLHVDGDVLEVNIVDFLLLETLRVFEPDLHEALFRERDLVLQERRFEGDGRQDADREAAERLLTIVSEERRDFTRDALKQLFPPLEWAFGGTHYAEGFRARWLAAKRVCSPRYFPRYFELQTADGEISERRFIAFLDATATEATLAEAIADMDADHLLPALAARLDESVDRLPVGNAAVLLPGMFGIAQRLAGALDAGPFNSAWISAWRAPHWFLKRISEDERGRLALEALRSTEALSVAAMLINLNDPAISNEDEGEAVDSVLHRDTVATMKADWLRLMRSRAADREALVMEPDLMSQLYAWRDYAGSLNEPREWMVNAIRTDDGFATMATRMMSRGRSHTWGDRVSTAHNSFDKKMIDDFIGIDVAKAGCAAIDPSAYPEHEEALRTLDRYLKTWLGLEPSNPLEI